MDFVILKDLRVRVRGLAAAGALVIAAACGGEGEESAAATPAATDSAAASTAAAPAQTPAFGQPPVTAGAPPASDSVLDTPMTAAQAAEAAASAQGAQGPVTPQALNSYQLTMPKLRALVQAGQNLGELQTRRPDLRDSMRIPTFDPNLLYQKLNSVEAARDAVNRAGISPEEYAIATSALIQATMVQDMRRRGQTPQGEFNERNVQFVAENWEEIQAITRAAAPRPPSGPRQP